MRDAKSLLLLLVSLLLVLVSFVLIWTWGYRFYNKDDAYNVNAKILITDSNAIVNRIRDSLQKVYNETLHSLDTRLDSTLVNTDSVKAKLDVKLNEFFKLSNEITAILKNRSNSADFNTAKRKIGELQSKADDLREKSRVVENENKKLGGILDQLNTPQKDPDRNIKQVNFEEKPTPEKSNAEYVLFTASELKLAAMKGADEKETETTQADATEKLVGSFTVLNNNMQLNNAEMIIVVLQPDGRVLKTSAWESGTFNTPEGKRIYSYKLNFNYLKGEAKRLLFSISTDKYQKGNYTMQIFYNGTMIGKMVKSLS
ncbi:MAG TPA: hypothetical protein VK489_16100 [Ferruginibacter sp.]|nr:hypothetical protein [Ferruginibacter sp.]